MGFLSGFVESKKSVFFGIILGVILAVMLTKLVNRFRGEEVSGVQAVEQIVPVANPAPMAAPVPTPAPQSADEPEDKPAEVLQSSTGPNALNCGDYVAPDKTQVPERLLGDSESAETIKEKCQSGEYADKMTLFCGWNLEKASQPSTGIWDVSGCDCVSICSLPQPS